MKDQVDREWLEQCLSMTRELLAESRQNKRELAEIRQELDALHATNEITDVTYAVHRERTRRVQVQNLDCLRRLEYRRKLIIEALHELS